MTRCSNERRESLDDFAHADADASKRAQDRPSGTWPFLVKRHIESDIALHVHVQFSPAENAESRDFCLTFECPVVDADLLKSCSGLRWCEVVKACIGDDARQVDELVPVEVGQTVEEPERVILRLAVPSLKRLFVLNNCLMIRSQKANSLLHSRCQFPAPGVSEVVSIEEDRKLDMVINDLLVISREITGHVIKSGPLVVESFSDEAATSGRWLAAGEGSHGQIAGLRCEVIDNTIRVSMEESLDRPMQSLQVLCGARQFVCDGVVRIRHEVNLAHRRIEPNPSVK